MAVSTAWIEDLFKFADEDCKVNWPHLAETLEDCVERHPIKKNKAKIDPNRAFLSKKKDRPNNNIV